MRNMDRCKRVVYTYTGEVQGHLRSLAWRSGVAEKIKTGLHKEAFYDETKEQSCMCHGFHCECMHLEHGDTSSTFLSLGVGGSGE